MTQKSGERWTARAPIGRRRDELSTILTDAVVERVLFEEGRVWGVAYQRDGQAREIRARRAVVLAGGAFQTPQLLMLSGIGPGEHLREIGLAARRRPARSRRQTCRTISTMSPPSGPTAASSSAARLPGTLKSLGAMVAVAGHAPRRDDLALCRGGRVPAHRSGASSGPMSSSTS